MDDVKGGYEAGGRNFDTIEEAQDYEKDLEAVQVLYAAASEALGKVTDAGVKKQIAKAIVCLLET